MSVSDTLLKLLDAGPGALVCRLIGWLGLFGTRRMPPPNSPIALDAPLNILIIRPGGIGDMVLLLPTLQALRQHYPLASLTILCERRNAELLSLSSISCTILVANRRPINCLKALIMKRFDVMIDTEQFHHLSALAGVISGAPMRIGFAINPVRNALYTHLATYDTDGYEGNQFLRLLCPLGLPELEFSLHGCLRLPDPAQQAGVTSPIIAIQPSTSSPYKDWPPMKFCRFITALHSSHKAEFILLGARHDKAACASVFKNLPDSVRCHCRIEAGQSTLDKTAALLASATLFVGPDSGLAHIATALDVPTITLFGATAPNKWAQSSPRHRTVNNPLPCAPCAIFGYHKPCNTKACIRNLPVNAVIEEAVSLLNG